MPKGGIAGKSAKTGTCNFSVKVTDAKKQTVMPPLVVTTGN